MINISNLVIFEDFLEDTRQYMREIGRYRLSFNKGEGLEKPSTLIRSPQLRSPLSPTQQFTPIIQVL